MPRSLHARMLALAAAATLAMLVIAGWVIAGVLGRFVTAGLDRRLDAEIALLATTVDAAGRIDRAALGTRLGALEQGPGWRWRIEAPGGAIGDAELGGLAAPPPRAGDRPPPPPPERGARPLDGRDADGTRLHARRLVLATRGGPVTLTAAAPREIVRRPIRGALVPLLALLAALAALMATTTMVQLRLGLRPLRRLRDQVAAIRDGARARVDEDQPAELGPLAAELNALADANAAALATARRSAADLAHALKTPVAALALDLADRPAAAAQVARLDAIIRRHLARARTGAVDRRAATPLAPALAALADAVRRLHAERALTIAVAAGDDLAAAVDPHDLDELVGTLLDNAARHARATVRVAAALDPADPRIVRLTIADDGPGIPAAARGRVAAPGVRLDERGDGHGFGLAIATDLAGLYGGDLTLDDAPEGGLLATLRLPASRL